jgi:hypothetical protein
MCKNLSKVIQFSYNVIIYTFFIILILIKYYMKPSFENFIQKMLIFRHYNAIVPCLKKNDKPLYCNNLMFTTK